jgi:hypothetical protein
MEVRNVTLEPICLVLLLLYERLYTGGSLYDAHHNITSEQSLFLSIVSWGWVRLSLLGTSATNWPIVAAPDGR